MPCSSLICPFLSGSVSLSYIGTQVLLEDALCHSGGILKRSVAFSECCDIKNFLSSGKNLLEINGFGILENISELDL